MRLNCSRTSKRLNELGISLSSALKDSKAAPHAPNLDVEMETGTGKTYVHIKTIMELHKRYGAQRRAHRFRTGAQRDVLCPRGACDGCVFHVGECQRFERAATLTPGDDYKIVTPPSKVGMRQSNETRRLADDAAPSKGSRVIPTSPIQNVVNIPTAIRKASTNGISDSAI